MTWPVKKTYNTGAYAFPMRIIWTATNPINPPNRATTMNDSTSPQNSSSKEDIVTAEDVISYLRTKIRNGHVVPGQRLVEADIMRETQASRGRVRSALQRLQADGFVVIEEYRGASVKRHSREEVLFRYCVHDFL